MAEYATESERLFDQYLTARDFRFEYEPTEVPGRGNPDFRVHTPSGVVECEVTELRWPRPPRRPVIDDEGGRPRHLGWAGCEPIRAKLKDKHKQGRHLKGKVPYVVVLYGLVPCEGRDIAIPSAMHGDVAFSVPVDRFGGPPPDRPTRNVITGKGAALQRDRLTTISAVAVLDAFNPTTPGGRAPHRASTATRRDRGGRRADHPGGVRDRARSQRVPLRLDTFHNRFAAEPRLQRGIFAGPHDREFDEDHDQYRLLWQGPLYGAEVTG